jgi:carbonic anhydrase
MFDQGVGDLFVVRVAGNIADSHGIGSLECAATALEVPLLMALGRGLKTPPTASLSPGGYDLEKGIVELIR